MGRAAAITGFFERPLPEKMAYCPPEKAKGHGYLPMGIESVARTLTGEAPPDLCEALVFAAPQRPESDTRNYWPDRPAPLVTEWAGEIVALSRDLSRLMVLALAQPEEPKPGQLRDGAHHDYGGLTLLRQDMSPGGPEIRDDEGMWHKAGVVPDSFVINVGALMARWTNNRWRSTLHRMSNPAWHLTGSTRRLSMVAFTASHEDSEMSSLPTCTSDADPAQCAPVKPCEYVLSTIRASIELTGAK